MSGSDRRGVVRRKRGKDALLDDAMEEYYDYVDAEYDDGDDWREDPLDADMGTEEPPARVFAPPLAPAGRPAAPTGPPRRHTPPPSASGPPSTAATEPAAPTRTEPPAATEPAAPTRTEPPAATEPAAPTRTEPPAGAVPGAERAADELAVVDLTADDVLPDEWTKLCAACAAVASAEARPAGSSRKAKQKHGRTVRSAEAKIPPIVKAIVARRARAERVAAQAAFAQRVDAEKKLLRQRLEARKPSAEAMALLDAVLDKINPAGTVTEGLGKGYSDDTIIEAITCWQGVGRAIAGDPAFTALSNVHSPGRADEITMKRRGTKTECTKNFIVTVGKHAVNVHAYPKGLGGKWRR